MGPIPNGHAWKHAFIPHTKTWRKRRKLLLCCFSSGIIQGCLIAGPTSVSWRLRPTARCSTARNDLVAMRIRTECTPAQRAAKYLERIAALTGVKQDHDGSYRLTAGRRTFLVDYKFVRLISHHGKSTCFFVATDPDMPSAEVVASALLQLKNNPRLFKKWRKQPGSTFKANGKMFRDTYQLTRDEI